MIAKNKQKVLAGFLLFLGFMAICTLIAKGIYKNGLPRVQTGKAEKKSLYYEISARGSVMPGEIYGVYVPQGLRVETVSAQVGEQVKEGDLLFIVDMEDLEEQIRESTRRKDYLNAQIKDLDNAAGRLSSDRKKLEEQLLADYDNLVKEYDLKVSNAEIAMESARLRMEAVKEDVSGSDLESQILRKEYEAATNAVAEARLRKEEVVKEWNRSLESSREESIAELAQKVQLRGELAGCEETLKKLKDIKEGQGYILAPEAGTLLNCAVETGSRTGDGACLLYARSGDGVEVDVPEVEGAILSIGDSVNLQCKSILGDNRKFEGRIRYQESANGHKILHIEADVSGLPAGQTVQMSYSYNSETYDMVIPRRALYQDNSLYYVYVLEQVEGILGTEYRPRKEIVTLLEQNGEYAAIRSSSVDAETEIIMSSNKEISEETAVRVVSK